uniref:C-type lectin domain-containing protein n=1 Tax=Sinocyclocheilus rhinocerous TaxID=307959 RepID=A0A673HZW5_9TELE
MQINLKTTCDDKLFFVCKVASGVWVLVKEIKTWQEAKQQCEMDHAGLAIISNEVDNNIIRALVDTGFAWIGVTTVQQNNPLIDTWRWVNNEPVTFSRCSHNNGNLFGREFLNCVYYCPGLKNHWKNDKNTIFSSYFQP